MNPGKPLSNARDASVAARPSAVLLSLPVAGARRPRREASPAEPLGQILLFTGVRYERMPEVEHEAVIPQRKRS